MIFTENLAVRRVVKQNRCVRKYDGERGFVDTTRKTGKTKKETRKIRSNLVNAVYFISLNGIFFTSAVYRATRSKRIA